MATTKISWTEKSWNPITGCSPVSAGCLNWRLSAWLKAMGQEKYKNNFEVTLHPECLNEPLHWRKPCRIFVCSMSDLFHGKVPFEFIDKVFAMMALCPQHTFQLLTKRPDKMAGYYQTRTAMDDSYRVDYMPQWYDVVTGWLDQGENGYLGSNWNACEIAAEKTDYLEPLSNLWPGVSVENQDNDWRIVELLKIQAAVRWASLEPLLGKICLDRVIDVHGGRYLNYLRGDWYDVIGKDDNGQAMFSDRPSGTFGKGRGIDWVVVGCESGPNRRPCKLEWVRDIVEQCQAAGVPVFVKQLDINGKVIRDINQFPKDVQIQDYPE